MKQLKVRAPVCAPLKITLREQTKPQIVSARILIKDPNMNNAVSDEWTLGAPFWEHVYMRKCQNSNCNSDNIMTCVTHCKASPLRKMIRGN